MSGDRPRRAVLLALAASIAGLCAIVAGLRAPAALLAATASRTPLVAADSASAALVPFGLALVALAGLLALPAQGRRQPRLAGALFATFLLGGAAALAALLAGPMLTDRLLSAAGYRQCAARVGVRTERSWWAPAETTCPAVQGEDGGNQTP